MPRNEMGLGRCHSAEPRKNVHAASLNTSKFSQPPRPRQAHSSARIIRLPIFRDGVFIGNEFIPISPRLRARIRQMAMEGRS